MMEYHSILQELCTCPSVSGREGGIRALLRKKIAPFAHELQEDALGNLMAVKRGREGAKTVALCAHMDEIGFLVTYVEDSGMLRVAPVGGIHWTASAFSALVSPRGICGALVPEKKTKAADFGADVFYLDLGAKNKEEALAKTDIGDFFVAQGGIRPLLGKRVMGRPLDDRIGCAVLLDVAQRLWETPTDVTVVYVFSVQEEVGCRGALPAAFGIAPDIALCFDVTATGDTLGASAMACSLGDGAAVKIKDGSVICHPQIVEELCRIAQEQEIPYQREILLRGGTDTSSMQMAGRGSRAGALSIPCRYIHSGVEVCDLGDAEACAMLATAFVGKLSPDKI